MSRKNSVLIKQEKFKIHTHELGPMQNFVYLIEDVANKTAAIVDPAWEVEQVIDLAEKQGIKITDILLTHSHHDHINGVDKVLDKFDAELHLLNAEAEFWGHKLAKPALHHGGDHIQLGDTEIEVLHTPGHTPGSTCYLIDDQLITGDTMFVFGCGRCDMTGGDPEVMFNTLRHMKETLAGSTVIHPGHNYSVTPTATMAEQIDGNPFMHFDKQYDFVEFRMHAHGRTRKSPYAAVSHEQAEKMLRQFD
ncbi:MAG: hydroxyacylglutathione hydrolase [Gammaproteobacteria bacterium]